MTDMRCALQKTMKAFFATQNMEGVQFVDVKAKTGYCVLDNGEIVGLDDDGKPTSEPFAGYVSDEHCAIAEARQAKAEACKLPPRVLKSEKWPQ